MRRVFWLVLLGSMLAVTTAAIDPAEYECEEAVAHIADCCGTAPTVHCGGTCEDVDLNIQNAACLRKASCDSIVSSGACEDPTTVGCK